MAASEVCSFSIRAWKFSKSCVILEVFCAGCPILRGFLRRVGSITLPVPSSVRRVLDFRIAMRYTRQVIKSFAHKGLEKFFFTGSTAGIQAKHARRLRVQLGMLDSARKPEDMNAPG